MTDTPADKRLREMEEDSDWIGKQDGGCETDYRDYLELKAEKRGILLGLSSGREKAIKAIENAEFSNIIRLAGNASIAEERIKATLIKLLEARQ